MTPVRRKSLEEKVVKKKTLCFEKENVLPGLPGTNFKTAQKTKRKMQQSCDKSKEGVSHVITVRKKTS